MSMLFVAFPDNKNRNILVTIRRDDDPSKTYGSPDVPHGRFSILYRAAKIINNSDSPCRYTLPQWTAAELESIRSGCHQEAEQDNPIVPVTEDEVLDRYYKHDPETGERTDEPTGEFPSIEACRAAMEAEREQMRQAAIAEETEAKYNNSLEMCLVAPAATSELEAVMEADKRITIFQAKDDNFPWPPKNDTEFEKIIL